MDSLLDDRPPLVIKAAVAVAIVALADWLLFDTDSFGANLGLLQLAFAAAALLHPDLRRSRLGLGTLAVAAAFCAVQIEHFSPLAWFLFWTALGVAVLAARAPAGEGAWPWAQRLVVLGAKSLVGPLLDLHAIGKARPQAASLRSVPLTLAMPVIGAVVFLWLFAVANPLIGDWFAAFSLPRPDIGRIVFWGFFGLLAWGTLRPRGLGRTWATPDAQGELVLPGVSTASITLSLVVFNAIFALQNGLDVAFLWSGAKLPDGMTFAAYAHRGAYPLIATALLAGLFVVAFLRPGTETGRNRLVRSLVFVWIGQNVFLVASTVLRTADYIEAYSLTRMRIAALIWMGLVALGLALIGWRLFRHKSTGWLINANVLAAGLVLAACSVVDLGSVAAGWNVRHARQLGGSGVDLDVCYLAIIGDPGLVPLAELEQRPLDGALHNQIAWARAEMMQNLARRQSDWRSWTWRGARRLAKAQALTAGRPTPGWWGCRQTAPSSAPKPAPPLTAPANPGT
jgi:hypothetical protein